MQEQNRLRLRGELRQDGLQRIQPFSNLRLIRRILLGGSLHLIDQRRDLDGFRHSRLPQLVLMEHVKGNREEVGLGAANRLVMVDPQQPQEDLLDQIGDIDCPVPQSRRKKPPQPRPVLLLDTGDERLLAAAQPQGPTPR